MGQPTMSTQSPQTGGKSGQYGQPGQPSGKGMAGGLMNAAAQQMPQQMPGTPLTADQMPQQADGNMGMGAPLPPMGGSTQGMQQTNPGGDMYGSGLGQSTNPQQPVNGFNPNNLPLSSMTSNLGGSQQNSFQPQMGEQKQMGLGASTQPAGGKGMAGMAANGIQAGMGQGNVTYPNQSGQPMMGMPNQYSNTVGRPNGLSEEGSMYKGGKGTGGSSYGSNA